MQIALIGYGKMGQLIHQIATERGHEVVCIVEPMHDAQCTMHNVPFVTIEDAHFRTADVAIEFTTPATAAENILKAWEAGVPVVSGTTGWNIEKEIGNRIEEEGRRIEEIGNRIQVVDERGKVWLIWKSNFSVGVNVFFDLNKMLAQALSQYPQYTPSITETHHIHKLDKPSGTAVTLAEGIHSLHQAKDTLPSYSSTPDRRPLPPIESIREGEVAGIHTVTWDSEEDTITITHSAKSRRGFALGAVLAAENLSGAADPSAKRSYNETV